MRTPLVAVAALLCGAWLLPGVVAAADQPAGALVLTDPVGDVWLQKANDPATLAPDVHVGDLTRAVVRNTKARVIVVLRFSDVARKGRFAQYDVWVQSKATKVRRELLLEAGPGRWKGIMRVFRPNGSTVSCPTSHHIDYGTDVVTIRMRSHCLGRAPSVRARINAYRGLSGARFYSDNPAGGKAQMTGWSAWVHR